jgi:hypothetical protein
MDRHRHAHYFSVSVKIVGAIDVWSVNLDNVRVYRLKLFDYTDSCVSEAVQRTGGV